MPLDVDALTALSDLATIAESGVDARTLDDVVVPAWVSAPYDEHLTQPLLRPEAPELAVPPAPLGLPLRDPRFASPRAGLAGLVEGEEQPAPLLLDRLPVDPDAPGAPEWPRRVGAAARTARLAVAAAPARARATALLAAERVRAADLPARGRTTAHELGALGRDVAADLRDMAPRLARLGVLTASTALVAGVLAPVLVPERPDGLSALAVLASASPLGFEAPAASPEPGSGSAAPRPTAARSSAAATTDPAGEPARAPSAAAPGTAAPDPVGPAAGPLDVLRAGLPFGQAEPAPAPRAVAAAAAVPAALPERSGTGRRLVLGPDRAWAVGADGSVVRTWPVVRGACPAAGTYRVRRGPASTDSARALVWVGRDGTRARAAHGVAAGTAPCGAARPQAARWLQDWSRPGSVVVILG